jgi:hypothetical protein
MFKVQGHSGVTVWVQEGKAFPYWTAMLKLSSVCPPFFLHHPRFPSSSLFFFCFDKNRHATLRLAAEIEAAGYTTSKADHVTRTLPASSVSS